MLQIHDDFQLGRWGGEKRNLLLGNKMVAAWVAWNPLSSERVCVKCCRGGFVESKISESLSAHLAVMIPVMRRPGLWPGCMCWCVCMECVAKRHWRLEHVVLGGPSPWLLEPS